MKMFNTEKFIGYNQINNRYLIKNYNEKLFEQIYNSSHYKEMYFVSDYEYKEDDLLQPRKEFYKNHNINNFFKRSGITYIQDGPACLFLTPKKDFAIYYASMKKCKFLYTVRLIKEYNLFNFSSKKDYNSLSDESQKMYKMLYDYYKSDETNPRFWMTVEMGNIIQNIFDLGYDGFNNYGAILQETDGETAENIALFEEVPFIKKENLNEVKKDSEIMAKEVASLFYKFYDKINENTLNYIRNKVYNKYGPLEDLFTAFILAFDDYKEDYKEKDYITSYYTKRVADLYGKSQKDKNIIRQFLVKLNDIDMGRN